MDNMEIAAIAVCLSMDAFAVSLCKGLASGKVNKGDMIKAGMWFGGFQAIMPVSGYFSAEIFTGHVLKYSKALACILLVFIGLNMLIEAADRNRKNPGPSMGFREMSALAFATSVDAFTAGITFSLLDAEVVPAACTAGAVTFVLSAAGLKIGSRFGEKYSRLAEYAGGILLVLSGLGVLF